MDATPPRPASETTRILEKELRPLCSLCSAAKLYIVAGGLTALPIYQSALQKLMEIQKRIFTDLAWEHGAYLTGGLKSLQLLYEYEGSPHLQFPLEALTIWQGIDSGDVEASNLAALHHEQFDVAQPVFAELGEYLGIPMGWEALAPIPNGLSFTHFSGSSLASMVNINNRWAWMSQEMWPKWLNFTDLQRRHLAQARLGSQVGRP